MNELNVKKIEELFKPLVDQFGFRLDWIDDNETITSKQNIHINCRYYTGRFNDEISISLFDNSKKPPQEYLMFYMMSFRDPERLTREVYEANSEERGQKRDYPGDLKFLILENFIDNLCNWFPDILVSGSFERLNENGIFDQYVREYESLELDIVGRLGRCDPIVAKYHNHDFTWFRDYKSSLDKGQ